MIYKFVYISAWISVHNLNDFLRKKQIYEKFIMNCNRYKQVSKMKIEFHQMC